MTSDPKAPGAAAVYLNYTEVTHNVMHYRSVYARIKVLQEKGKELATVEIPYWWEATKIHDIKGRTIHPDGSISTLIVKPEDLLWQAKGDFQIHRKVFTLPNVEVGSILEYRYQEDFEGYRFTSLEWELQKAYFVHKAHFLFEGCDSMGSWTQLPPGAQLKYDGVGGVSLDVTDIPPIPNEDWMPPIESFLYRVHFYFRGAYDNAEFWESATQRWSKETDSFAEPTKLIHQAVSGIVSPADSEIDKARKLYKAVQALDNTEFSRQKDKAELKRLGLRVPKRAQDTWEQKSGSRQDIALLYLAMLRAANLTAYDAKVVNRDRSIFIPGYRDFNQLDDDIVILKVGDKEIFLDPGEKMCPFQTLHWKHSGAAGVRQNAGDRGPANSPLQQYVDNVLTRVADMATDEQGLMTGTIRFSMRGQEALYWRQQALVNDEDEVKKKFDRMLERVVPEGVEAHIDRFVALDDPDSNLVAIVKAQGRIGAATSKRLMLPGFFFEARERTSFVDEAHRETPVDMRYAERVIDQVTYRVPATLALEGMPQNNRIAFANQAELSVLTKQKPGEITMARSLARGFTFLKPDQYQDMRVFYQKVAENDQQQIVLTQAIPQKGN